VDILFGAEDHEVWRQFEVELLALFDLEDGGEVEVVAVEFLRVGFGFDFYDCNFTIFEVLDV